MSKVLIAHSNKGITGIECYVASEDSPNLKRDGEILNVFYPKLADIKKLFLVGDIYYLAPMITRTRDEVIYTQEGGEEDFRVYKKIPQRSFENWDIVWFYCLENKIDYIYSFDSYNKQWNCIIIDSIMDWVEERAKSSGISPEEFLKNELLEFNGVGMSWSFEKLEYPFTESGIHI